MGKQQQQELENRLTVLFEHLLKLAYWDAEKADNCRGWKGTVREQRKHIKRLRRKNPSLNPYLAKVQSECYRDAREITLDKTGLEPNHLPKMMFVRSEQILDEDWLPDS